MGRADGQDGHLAMTQRFGLGWAAKALAIASLALSAAACAQEPDMASLTAITFNYAEGYAVVWVNGQWAGGGADSVEPGDVAGGGGICCIEIPVGAKTASVEIQTDVDEKFVTQARIEQPWPEGGHYAAVHVLPGRTVVIEVAGSNPAPRTDLLGEALKKLGVTEYTIQAPYAWDSGPQPQL